MKNKNSYRGDREQSVDLLRVKIIEWEQPNRRKKIIGQDDLMGLRTKKNIHKLVPGVTGWAQVNGRDDLPIPVKVSFDEYYLSHRSFALDLYILLLTAIKVIKREGVQH